MLPLLLTIACMERVTDRAIPLDPRFYEGGSDADNPGAGSGQLGVPWANEAGEKVELSFAITGHEPGTVQLDVVVEDAAAPGGLKRLGRVEGTESPLMLSVPTSVSAFTAEVFQDVTQDGPSDDDPYATLKVDLNALPEGPIPVVLVVGARPVPTGGGPEGGGGGGMAEPWAGYSGETVTFNAVILSDDEGAIQVDFAEIDAASPGGQKRVGQLRLPIVGAVSVEVPKSLEKFRIEAFQDRDGDGPLGDDPYAELTTIVASIGATPVTLQLVVGSRGQAGSGGAGEGAGPVGPGGGPQAPWEGMSGPTVTFAADIVVATPGEIQIDVNQADPTAPGGQKRVGQVRLMGAGPVSFPVPTSVSSFSILAFQDLDHNGPGGDEPSAELTVAAADVQTRAKLTLVAGGRRQPGSPSTPGPPPSEGVPAIPSGPSVELSGAVRATAKQKVVIDIFQAGASGGSARKHLYKTETNSPSWELRVPTRLGAIEIEAYQDAAGDGPKGDVVTRYAGSVVVSESDLKGLDLALP